MKKLLLINDFEEGGGAEEVFRATRKLLSEKFIVKTFIGCEKHLKPVNHFSYIYSVKNQGSSFSRIYSFRNYKRLLDVLLDFKPHLVHLHNYYSFLSPSILNAVRTYRKRGNGLRVIFTAHDFHLLCPFSSFMHYSFISNRFWKLEKSPNIFQIFLYKWDERGFPFSMVKKLQWVYAYVVNDFYKEIDHIISPSEFLAGFLRIKYRDIPVTIVRNPIVGLNSMDQTRPVLKDKNKKMLRIVFVGRLSPEKGLMEFIECLKKINDIPYIFKIIGEGSQVTEIIKKIETYNMVDKVILTGAIVHSNVLEELAANDALVLPSIIYENAPISLVEGAFAGLRLITTNYGGMKEMGELCGGAYFIDLDDLQSVKNALTRCFHDVIAGKPIVNRDKEMLQVLFSDANYKKQLMDVYNN